MKTVFIKKWLAVLFLSFFISAIFAFLDVFGSFLAGIVISVISNNTEKTKSDNIIFKKLLWLVFSISGLYFTQMVVFKEFEMILYVPFVIVFFGNWLLYGSKNK